MKETSKSIYVDVDPDDPLSDEAFTAQHPVEEWFRLPLEWRIEIERQRFVKKGILFMARKLILQKTA